jgi:hypothetical protein
MEVRGILGRVGDDGLGIDLQFAEANRWGEIFRSFPVFPGGFVPAQIGLPFLAHGFLNFDEPLFPAGFQRFTRVLVLLVDFLKARLGLLVGQLDL